MPLSPRTLSVRTLTRARLHQRQAARLLLQSLEERVVPANSVFAVGSDAGSTAQVLVYDAATRALLTTLSPFPTSFTGGVRVAVADVTGDGAGDVVVSEGPGGTNQVRVYDGATFKALKGTLGGFAGFTTAEADGVWVAAGDVSGDGKADLVLGTDGAHTPKVKILSGANGSLVRNVDLAGFDAPNGVRVAAGDVTGDGKADAVIAAGPGGPPRVVVADGATGARVRDFFAFDPADRGGVHLAAGDVTGDGYADVVTGMESGDGLVKVFSGRDSSSFSNLDAFPGSAGGVRVGVADADADGRLDVVASEGAGGGAVTILAAALGAQAPDAPVATLQPFGTGYTGGAFAAGDGRPAGGAFSLLSGAACTVQITGVKDTIEGNSHSAEFTITRTGDTSQLCYIRWAVGGTASGGADYETDTGITFGPGTAVTTFRVGTQGYDDTIVEGTETFVLTLLPSDGSPNSDYDLGQVYKKAAKIFDNDAPPQTQQCGCGSDSQVRQAPGMPAAALGAENLAGGDLADGSLALGDTDLVSDGFGGTMAQARRTVTHPGYNSPEPFGPQTILDDQPYLLRSVAGGQTSSPFAAVAGGDTIYFDPAGTNTYAARHYGQEKLTYYIVQQGYMLLDAYRLTDTAGDVIEMWGWGNGVPAAQRGRFKSQTDADGNVTNTTYDAGGNLTELTRTSTTNGVTTTESLAYTYSAGKVATATLRRKVGAGSYSTIRSTDYTYGGALGNLSLAVVKDATGAVLDSRYYRYATSTDWPGAALGYAFGPDAYDRLTAYADAHGLTVDQVPDAVAAGFADQTATYDYVKRVVSAGSAAAGQSTFEYETETAPDGYNLPRTKVIETQPGGAVRTTYLNFAGEVILGADSDPATGLTLATYRQYDDKGRLTLEAPPGAVAGYTDTLDAGLVVTLNPAAGRIETTSYYASTSPTISETVAGGVAGRQYQTFIQRGSGGTPILQSTTDYFSRTAGTITVYPVAHETRYRNADGTGGQTTSYAYTYFTGAIQPQQVTTTLPAVTTAQNGSGAADSSTVVYDDRGRVIWARDAAGYLTYTAYDDVTGGVTKVIEDVDTTQTATFADLPAGWATPAGGGLHLTTLFELDAQGRPVTETDPGGGVTYTVYKDPEHETRVYRWDPVNGVRIGPTVVTRDDHDHGYSETLTMSAAPNLTGGRPDGTEAVSDIQSLSRTVVNDAGQTVAEDQYFDLTGVPYDPAAVTLGTAGVNYLRTQYGYDAKGRQVRAVSPAGTITRTVYDGFDRPVGTWVGTDDAPTGGDWTHWSPTNTAGTDLVQVSATEYDNGGVGDGLVTRETEMPGTPYANRVTQTAYDWRDRPVATKEGADSSEDPSVNRPITYADLDNLGEAIASEMYDGDGLSITADADSDGVPDRPSASALRAKSTADYDELGRAYQSKTFSVDPANGTVSTNALVSQWWYNSRGLEMKASSPGGLVTKSEFDGLGRTTKSYVTDGGGDGTYADAGDVTGDTVLSQTEWTFDPDGNPTLVTTRDRFHDETRTGPLGDPGSADKAKARASYQAMYYDPADRLVTAVDVGTNGGTAYTRPTTPDARDDTHHRTDYAYNSAGEVETVTDPKGLKTTTDYDLLGRVTKTVENDVDMPASDADDKTTEYTYDAGGHQATLKANLTGGGYQETKWVYGITGPVVSNDILKEVQYPDPSTGDASPGQTDSYTYNRLGEVLAQADRNGTTHAYSLDVLGRQTLDAVSQLGAGVDGTVMQIGTAYDGQGNPYLVTSYDGTGGVVNQVQRAYNGLGQLIQEWQAVNGTVNTSTTPSVQYGYSFLPAGTNNNSRLTSITYPNGRRLDYEYAAGLADSISRLSDIKDGSTVLESYNYLGLGTVVTRAHPQPGVDLTYAKLAGESDGPAGDQYLGLDRFGQVVDQRWTTSGGANVDRYQYAYDRDGNRTSRTNVVNPAFNETYGYDGLNQLTGFNTTGTAKSWDYDAAGNWDGVTTNGATQTRTHDRQNEIGSATGQTAPTYDADGNQTTDFAGRAFTYDAWDRVRTAAGHTYEYDGLGRRVADTAGATTTDAYYTAAWQVAEERVNGTPRRQYVWSPVYVDALVLRDRDADNNGTLEERLWAAQDADYNVTAVFDNAGNVVERYAYDPYGAATVYDAGYNVRSGGSLYTWTYLFQGYAWDPTTGKYHARHRDYDPVEGRFASNDPLAFAAGDVNFYRFVANQPTNYRDPSGEAIVFDDEAAAKAFMGDMGNKYGAKHLKLIKGRKGQFYVTGDVRDRDAFFKYADDAFPGTLTKTLFDETDELRKLAARRQNFLMAAGVAGACAFDFVSGKDGSEATFGSTDGSLLTEDRDRRLKEKGGNAPAIVDIGGTGDEHGAINVNINGDYGGTKIPRLMPRIGKSGDLPFMDGSVSKVIMESVPLSGDVLTSTAKEIARIAQSGGEIRLKNPNNETSKRIHDAVSAALGRRLGDRTSSVDKDGNLTTVLRVK